MPLVAQMISELDHIPLNKVKKGNGNSVLTYGDTKNPDRQEDGGDDNAAV